MAVTWHLVEWVQTVHPKFNRFHFNSPQNMKRREALRAMRFGTGSAMRVRTTARTLQINAFPRTCVGLDKKFPDLASL